MAKAAGLYRLHLTIALGGGLGVALALLVAVDAVTHSQSPGMLIATILFPESMFTGASAALLLGLSVIVASSLALGLRAACRELRSQRRAADALRDSSVVEVGSTAVGVIADNRPRAFCHGLLRPRIYVSSGTLTALSRSQLEALLAHERHHAVRRDPLRLAVARVLGGALFFLPALRPLLDRYSDEAELAADEAALRDGRDVEALAAALLTFDERGGGVHPARVDRLMGERADLRAPTASVLAAAAIIVVVVALGLTGATLNGHVFLVVAGPALLVAAGLVALTLATPLHLLGALVESRRGRRTR